MLPVFKVLASLRRLRGTPLDIFARSPDRKLERELIPAYERDVATVLEALSPVTLETAIELLSLPDRIRGYGPVKAGNIGKTRQKQRRLLDQISASKATMLKAA